MSLRSVLALSLAAVLLPAAAPPPLPAQQGRWVRLEEPQTEACRRARSARARQQTATCVMGTAADPAGVARVLVNGAPATLTPDSAGGFTRFVGFVPAQAGTTQIEVTMHPAAGEPLVQRYAIVSAEGAAGAVGTAYSIQNLNPRLLGAATGPETVAQAEVPPPAAPAQQVAAAEPAPVSTTTAAAADSAPAGPAAPAAAQGDAAPAPGPAASSASASPAAPVATAEEGPRDYVRIRQPTEWSTVQARGLMVVPRGSVRVEGEAQHSTGVTRVEINGVRVSTTTTSPSGEVRFSGYAVHDPARSGVEVVVRGNSGPPLVKHYPMAQAPAAVAGAAPPQAAAAGGFRGRRWAVVVGISAYQDTAITGLRYADDDARAFYEFLRSPMSGGYFAEENVKLLLNERATYREIRSALFTFLQGATDRDQVVIYFAGHGAPDPQRMQNLYLLTHDTDLADISGTAFPMDDVQKAVRDLYARDILVITDACHSAGVGGGRFAAATRDLGVNQINESFLQALNASSGGLAIFTASGANQLSQEDERWGGGHGVFTHYLLEGLRGPADEDGDKIVTLLEMMEYTRAQVRTATRNAQIPTISQTAYDPNLPIAMVLGAGQADTLRVPGKLAEAETPGAPAPATTAAAAAPPAPVASAAPPAADAGATRGASAEVARLREAVTTYPRSARYRRELGVALRRAGQAQEAIKELQEAARLEPQNAEPVYELGQTYRSVGLGREAIAELESAVRLDGRSGVYANALGTALLESGQAAEGLERLRRAVRLEPGRGAFHRDLGVALGAAGRTDDAVESLRQAVALEPRNAAYRVALGRALDAAGLAHEGVVEYAEAARIEPASAAHKAALAASLRSLGRTQEAVAQMKEAVRLAPANAAFRHRLGGMMRDANLPFEMLTELREAARLAPDSAAFRHDLGMALRGAGRVSDALPELREAARLAPSSAAYQAGLGVALKDGGVPQEALAALREAVRLAPEEARHRFELGLLLRDLGLLDEAVTELDSAVRLDRSTREYRQALDETRRRARESTR